MGSQSSQFDNLSISTCTLNVVSGCYDFDLGMEAGYITDDEISVTSGSGTGRLNVSPWTPSSADTNPSITISFPITMHLSGFTLLGKNKKYFETVAITYTLDGVINTLTPDNGVVSILLCQFIK